MLRTAPARHQRRPGVAASYQRNPQIDEHRQGIRSSCRLTPALVGIDDEACRRRRLPHHPHPFEIAVAPQFQLSSGRVRLAAASSAILSGVLKATVNAVMSGGTPVS